MIKTRLVGLLSHAKKYIVYTILWQWAALLSQVLAVFTIADLLERVVYRAVTVPVIERTILILVLVVIIRFVCERMGRFEIPAWGYLILISQLSRLSMMANDSTRIPALRK